MADNDAYQYGSVDDSPVVSVVVPAGTGSVRVINRSGAAELAVTTNGVTPSLTGNNVILPAAVGASAVLAMENAGTVVKLLSSAVGVTYGVWVES